ncbi:MAG TPA: ATPase, partial [Candidatus Rifleibacterium sp.]|nr:ATPase [Candidatus Rifleibacterium sp.]
QTLAGKGYQLYYWCSEHTAELDFVLQKGSAIIGIEVKKAQQIKSKSLNVFIQKYQPSCSIKLSEKNFAVTDSNVRLVPLYAAFCI